VSTQFTEPDAIPPIEVPWFQQREHYGAIVALLRAWELDAHISSNTIVLAVHIATEDGREVVWSNYTDTDAWAWSSVNRSDGEYRAVSTELAGITPAEEVARVITETDYSAGITSATDPESDP
jgi:hypothetical protein